MNELVRALQKSYKRGDVAMVKRLSALLGFSRGETVETVADTLDIFVSTIYRWLTFLLVEGVHGLQPRWKGGRHPKLTVSQKKRLAELVDAGPPVGTA